MIPAWVQMANGDNGWSTKASELPNGELLTVTATNPKEIQHIRGLGFIGLLASGVAPAAPSGDGERGIRPGALGPRSEISAPSERS